MNSEPTTARPKFGLMLHMVLECVIVSVEPTPDKNADSIVMSKCPEDSSCFIPHVSSAKSLSLYTSSGSICHLWHSILCLIYPFLFSSC